MQPSMHDPELQPLKALVGEWTTEATHPAYASTVVYGHTAVEWLEGEHFLIQRSQAHHSDFPDAIAIIGAPAEGLSMHYFDSRGVHRVYDVSLSDGVWRMWREAPGFSQRFTGTFADEGNTISGRWELSRDGSRWDDDLQITYRRVTTAPKVLLRSEQSAGEVSVIEVVASPGRPGPALHHHPFDEAFYVLEGELTFQLEDQVFTRKAGELAFAPRDVPHTYANLSGARARTLIVCTPAGFERYFARIAAKVEGAEPPPWALQEIPEVIRVGPPIGENVR